MKINRKKAYDSMEWSFISRVMKACLFFIEQFQQLFYSCMNSVTFNLLLNRSMSERIKPCRGLQ